MPPMPQDVAKALPNPRRRPHGLVGIIVNSVTSSYFAPLMEHTSNSLKKLGYHIVVQTHPLSTAGEIDALNSLHECRCDGYIFHSSLLKRAQIKSILQTHPTTIVIGQQVAGFEHRCVGFDNYAGGQLMANYLLQQKHRKIAMVTGPQTFADVKQRSAGFMDALGLANVDPVAIVEGNFERESGARALTYLQSLEPGITAIFFQNDEMAAGALDECRRQQIDVPQMLSIVGFDHINQAGSPSLDLTTIKQPIPILAETAAHRLHNLLRGSKVDLNKENYTCFPPTLIEGNSSAPPDQLAATAASLTRRERECLAWTAIGKTSQEISRIIGVTESTVNFHLKNTISKLDAGNRTHAVAIGIGQGLINDEYERVLGYGVRNVGPANQGTSNLNTS